MQSSLDFPQPLTEKYRPLTIAGFIGLEKQKRILAGFVKRPKSSAWFFIGPPGVGKSTMALALASELGAELHHIPSQKANVQNLDDVVRMCWYVPKTGKFHLVLVDEVNDCSSAFQLALYSKLDSTDPAPNTIWVFTANADDRLQKAFLSRCNVLEFSSYGMRVVLAELLADVWQKETGTTGTLDWERIAKDSTNNVRAALSALEMELLAQ